MEASSAQGRTHSSTDERISTKKVQTSILSLRLYTTDALALADISEILQQLQNFYRSLARAAPQRTVCWEHSSLMGGVGGRCWRIIWFCRRWTMSYRIFGSLPRVGKLINNRSQDGQDREGINILRPMCPYFTINVVHCRCSVREKCTPLSVFSLGDECRFSTNTGRHLCTLV